MHKAVFHLIKQKVEITESKPKHGKLKLITVLIVVLLVIVVIGREQFVQSYGDPETQIDLKLRVQEAPGRYKI